MYFKVLIFFFVSFSFNFVNSFTDSSELNQILANYANKRSDSTYVDDNARIKSFGIKKLSSLCYYVIKNLRKEGEYKNMYANYLLFKFNEYTMLCPNVKIWVPMFNSFIDAPVCFCFGRPAILSLEYPQETVQRSQELSFYPLNHNQIAVYKINVPDMYYTLLEIFKCIDWQNITDTPDFLFDIPVPVSYSEIINLRKRLDPFIPQIKDFRFSEVNVLHTLEDQMFPTLCALILRHPKYEKEIIYETPTNRRKPTPQIVTILFPGFDSFHINVFTCAGVVPETFKRTWKYRIAAGPKTDSVIVLKGINISNNNHEMASSSNVNQQAFITNYSNLHHGSPSYVADYIAPYSTTNANHNNVPHSILNTTDVKNHKHFAIIEYIECLNTKFLEAHHYKQY